MIPLRPTSPRHVTIFGVLIAQMLVGGASVAAAGPSQSDWVSGYNSQVRLLAGADAAAAAGSRIVAGVEIATKPDWKTYWRNPGDAGVPPMFDWSKSVNVASADVRYPAPRRLVDKGGVTIGYLGGVVFPVMVKPTDPAKPVALRLSIDYGVCKDICVPAQAELNLDFTPGEVGPLPESLSAAVRQLPSARGSERPGDPVVKAATVELAATPPRLTLDVQVPEGTAADAVDAFLVTDEGGFMPLPSPAERSSAGTLRLVVDLSKDVDIKDLRGKTVYATVTAPSGATETAIAVK